ENGHLGHLILLQMGIHAVVKLRPTKPQDVLCVQLPLELREELRKKSMFCHQALDRLTRVFPHPPSLFAIAVILGVVGAPDGRKEATQGHQNGPPLLKHSRR
ncbi:MAG TPA: hypothetical protein VII97_08680, partial [Anaerolineales bacterium]